MSRPIPAPAGAFRAPLVLTLASALALALALAFALGLPAFAMPVPAGAQEVAAEGDPVAEEADGSDVSPAEEATGGDDPPAAFDAAYAEFAAAYRAAEPDRVAALYTDDAYYLQPNSEIARGDVRSHFAWLADREPGNGPVISFDIVDRDVSGDLAYDIGIYTAWRDDAPDTPAGRGKFIVIWKRGTDGTWKIHADGFSNIAPPAAEAP